MKADSQLKLDVIAELQSDSEVMLGGKVRAPCERRAAEQAA